MADLCSPLTGGMFVSFSDAEAKGDDDASLIGVFLSFTQQRVGSFSRTRDSFTKIFLTGVRPVLSLRCVSCKFHKNKD